MFYSCRYCTGVKYPSPVILGPVGVQGIMHADAEIASARAASTCGIPFTLSTAASRTIEDVAKEGGDGPKWYQLYWPKVTFLSPPPALYSRFRLAS